MATAAGEAAQPQPAAGDDGGASPGGASVGAPAATPPSAQAVTPEIVLGRLAEAVSQLAAASGSSGGSPWKESKWIKSPEVFSAKTLDEEVALWPDWSFSFRNFMAVQAETATMWASFEDYSPALRARSLRLYSVLASYLKGRALKILRSVASGDGFRVWRQLAEELQPSSRPRTLALAQALTKFPPLRDGGSVLEYALTFEKLVSEYEKASSKTYPDDLKIGTLLSGLPQDVKRYLELQIDDSTTYQKLRGILLQFERTSTTWSTEYVMKAIGLDKNSYPGDGQGLAPMDVDRVEKGKAKGKDAKGKGRGDKGKGLKGYKGYYQTGKGKPGFGKGFQFGGFGKGNQDKGKGYKGKWAHEGGKQGKKGGAVKGPCFVCGRMGHRAAECRDRRVNHVEDDNVCRMELDTMPLIEELPDDDGDTTGAWHSTALVSEFDFYEGEEAWDEYGWWDESEIPAEAYEYIRAVSACDGWYSDSSAEFEEVDFASVECFELECELPSTSTLCFELDRDSSGDEFFRECSSECDCEVRAVCCPTDPSEPCEVILDSGADVTVLPAHLFSTVGVAEKQTTRLLDAQGTPIPQMSQRANVSFVVQGLDGREIVFRDRAVLANVRQPLLCAGKLFRGGWYPKASATEDGVMVMCKGEQEFPLHFARNSVAATMRILRTEEACVRVVIEVSDEFLAGLKRQGWQVTSGSTPTHVQWNSTVTADPSQLYDPEILPLRTTLVHKGENRFEIFECGENWELKPVVDIGCQPTRIVTLLTQNALAATDLGKVVADPQSPLVPRLPAASQEEAAEPGEADDGVQQPGAPVGGPEMQEVPLEGEVVKVGDKEEIALNKLKSAVQASDAVIAEYTPDVNHGPLPQRPDAQTVMLHELTHLPRADWCESCQAALSREDPHPEVQPKREVPVISVDWMFNRTGETENDEHPLTTQLVAVCHTTKYVVCVPVRSKAAEDNKPAVEELVKMASILGFEKVTFRGDSEPSMKKLLQMVQMARTRLGLKTEIETANPDSSEHQGLRAERYIDKVRRLGLCLLHTVSANSKVELKSSHPLYQWSFRHAAFLLTRYHVHTDGVTSFELVHGRKFDAKIAAFGSVVFCQLLPKPKTKGIPWEKCVYIGRSSMGSLSIVSSSKGIGYARTVPEVYQADALLAMRGVPWNPLQDVVTMRVPRGPRVRVPLLVDAAPSAAPPGDEAASDPPTSATSEAPAGSPGESILDGLSGAASNSSHELIPAAMEVGRVEWFPVRVVDAEQPHGHEDDIVVCVTLKRVWSYSATRALQVKKKKGDAGMPWEGREYVEGPPELEAQALADLDKQMELKELDRLLGMTVLRPMNGEQDREGKVRLQCKYVLDWRYRNGWLRRARLVAKEYRFLEPSLTDLYSPASVSCSHKLLACLAAGNSSLELLSVDITDAYLQVRQRRPTYIQTHIGDVELLYNLPGQRAGAKDWFTHLLGILKNKGLNSFIGNPSLFCIEQKLALNSHVDDMQILGPRGAPMQLASDLKAEGLKLKVDGPVDLGGGCSHFLKKKFQGLGDAIEVTQDTKYAERLQSILGLEKAHGKQNPSPPKIPAPGQGASLDSEHLHLYKRCVGILMYMSAERPDLQYMVKVLSSRNSSPTVEDFGLLRHVVKYLKLHPVVPIRLEQTKPGKTLKQKWDGVDPDEPEDPNMPFGAHHVLEVVTDADWGSQAFSDRRSISSFCIFLNGNLCHAGNKVQKTISLSSAESELMATLLGLSEGIFLKHMLQFLVGSQATVKLVHMVDNAATRSILQRQGLGRTRHISLGYLWAQKALNEGVYETKAIPTKDCPADLQTKPHPRTRMNHLMSLMGLGINHSVTVNQVSATPIATNMGAGQILRALALLLEGGVVTGQFAQMSGHASSTTSGFEFLFGLSAQKLHFAMFFVMMVCVIGLVVYMAPKRRWNRESTAPCENMNQVRDRVHQWLSRELGIIEDGINQTPFANNGEPGGTCEDTSWRTNQPSNSAARGSGDESWLLCPFEGAHGSDDEGQANEDYTQSYYYDGEDLEEHNEVENEAQDVPHDPRGDLGVDKVYIIGEAKRGKSYHKVSCGNVVRWMSHLPSNVKKIDRQVAVNKQLKACKQCKP
ncbi:unnamed protein product [Symbiodinium sp. CCMP2592]|nr:unnamed protein product [Symbiodinium sp. CCMP2592]